MNARAILTILIVNFNSADFIDNGLYCLKKLTKSPYKVIILDNNSVSSDFEKLREYVEKYRNVELERREVTLTGSRAHADGLNFLVKKIDTQYFSILDPDAAWLIEGWDEILINRINKKVKVIGSQASSNLRPLDFPLVYTILFETKTFKDINTDFSVGDLSKYEDVGYKLREKYLENRFKGEVFISKNTRQFKNGPFKDMVGVTEYYLDNSEILASHFGRGSSSGAAKYQQGFGLLLYSLPLIGKYFLKRKGRHEKLRWIKICQNIVEGQINNEIK